MSEDQNPIGDEPIDNVPDAPKAKRVRKSKSNGDAGQKQGKSDARIIANAKAIARAEAETPEILNRNPAPGPDPDDLELAIVDQAYLNKAGSDMTAQPTKTRKPGKDFFRVFPHYHYFNLYADSIEGKIDKNYYFVMPQMATRMEGETFKAALLLCVNSSGIQFLWPLPELNPDRENRWTESAWTAVKIATEKWTKIRSNQKPGAGYYDSFTAKGDLGEPEFTVTDMAGYLALVKAATPEERKIKTTDHPVMAKVEGRKK